MIVFHLDEIIHKRGRSYYWVTQQTGISGQNLKKIASNKTDRVFLNTLERLCNCLDCSFDDLMEIVEENE